MDIRHWILTGAVTGLLLIVKFFSNKYFSRIDRNFETIANKLDELIKSINNVVAQNVKNEEKISTLNTEIATIKERLNNHTDRIRKLEDTQLKCRNCNP